MNDDLIRRSDAIRATWQEPIYTDPLNILTEIRDGIEAIPSVEKPKGEWIRKDYWSEGIGMGESYGFYYECSNCGKQAQGGYYECGMNYCPNCGSQNQKVSE